MVYRIHPSVKYRAFEYFWKKMTESNKPHNTNSVYAKDNESCRNRGRLQNQ